MSGITLTEENFDSDGYCTKNIPENFADHVIVKIDDKHFTAKFRQPLKIGGVFESHTHVQFDQTFSAAWAVIDGNLDAKDEIQITVADLKAKNIHSAGILVDEGSIIARENLFDSGGITVKKNIIAGGVISGTIIEADEQNGEIKAGRGITVTAELVAKTVEVGEEHQLLTHTHPHYTAADALAGHAAVLKRIDLRKRSGPVVFPEARPAFARTGQPTV